MDKLLRTCRDLDAQPPPLGDAHARAFFSSFSFEALFRLLGETVNGGGGGAGGGAGGGRPATPSDLRLVCDVVSRLLATPLGHSMLADALPYLAAACAAPVPPLRRLAAEQYGRLLTPGGGPVMAGADEAVQQAMETETEGGGSARESSEMEVDSGGGGYGSTGTETACCLQLVRLLYDADTAVAAAAADGLRAYGRGSLAALRRLVGQGSEVAAALAAAAAADGSTAGATAAAAATVRLRVAALALDLAVEGGPDPGRLQLLYDSGLLAPLQRQLSDRGDPLAALAALQLVEEHLATATTAAATAAANGSIPYGTSSGSGSGGDGGTTAVAALLLPQLLSLLSDPAVADAAMPVVAGIVRHSLPYALPAAAVAAALASSNGAAGPHAAAPPHPATVAGGPGLAAAPALLAAVRRVLDERGDASAAAEACGLDAAGSLGLSRAGAQLVLADAELTNAMCERALGRSPHPEVRCAALHALASCAGLERAGEEAERSAALLPAQAEETLRRGVFRACGAKRPSEVVAGLMAQPFSDVRIAVYRFLSALLLRAWFAHEVVSGGGELMDRLTTPDGKGGASAATWRHAAACALWSTLRAAAAAAAGTALSSTANGGGTAATAAGLLPGEEAFVGALAAAEPRLRAAVQAGPYGSAGGGGAAGREAMHEQHFVATRGAGGGA